MRQWWSARPDSVPWTSGGLSLGLTTALFTAAFLAMRTVRISDFDFGRSERALPTMVELTPPPPRVEPLPEVRRPVPATPRPVVPPTAAVPVLPTVTVPIPQVEVVPPVRVEPVRPEPASDTTGGRAAGPVNRGSLTKMVPMREIPTFTPDPTKRVAAPVGPAGVAAHNGTLSVAERDAIATAKMATIPLLAEKYQPTAQQVEQLRQQNEPGLPRYGRAARMPGGAVSVPLMNGGYAVGVMGFSIALPNYDRTTERRLDADNQARLRRLQDRAALVRDSIRADSLKRDSLTRIRP